MINKTLTVEAAAAKDPTKYLWFKLDKAKAKFNMHHKSHDLELERGGKFGLKQFKDKYFLLPGADLTMQFTLSEAEAKKLVKSSTQFRGQVAKKKVTSGSWEELQPKAKKVKEPKVPKEPRVKEPRVKEPKHPKVKEPKAAPSINGASLRDTLGRKALDDDTLPKELLSPGVYQSSWYGRIMRGGRKPAGDRITIGFAMVKGKYSLIVVDRGTGNREKANYRFVPESRLSPISPDARVQVDYNTFLDVRKKGYRDYHTTESNNKDKVAAGSSKIESMGLKIGQKVIIKFSNGKSNEEILGIDLKGGRIQIMGGGTKRRWIPADIVEKRIDSASKIDAMGLKVGQRAIINFSNGAEMFEILGLDRKTDQVQISTGALRSRRWIPVSPCWETYD